MLMELPDEKFLFLKKRTVKEGMGFTRTNAMDIVAIGFDPKEIFIFSNLNTWEGPCRGALSAS